MQKGGPVLPRPVLNETTRYDDVKVFIMLDYQGATPWQMS
jgi:hypothetical protein